MADLVRGQTVAEALHRLKFITKRASSPVAKLIQSAMANLPTEKKASADQLVIKSIAVDKGLVFKRFRARARGQSSPLHKHTSRISVILEATRS